MLQARECSTSAPTATSVSEIFCPGLHLTTHDIPQNTWSEDLTNDPRMIRISHSSFFRPSHAIWRASSRSFRSATHLQACHTDNNQNSKDPKGGPKGCHSHSIASSPPQPLSAFSLHFWNCRSTWRRAGVNTLRCLVGCTAGDFSALWILQTYYPELGMGSIMAMSSESSLEAPNYEIASPGH